MDSSLYDIKVHNLVYTCFFNRKVNLDHVALKLKELGIGFDYNPKKFAAIFLRSINALHVSVPQEFAHSPTIREYFFYTNPRSRSVKEIGNEAVLLFSGKKSDEGGKMVCTGVKLEAQARFILDHIEKILNTIGYDTSITKYEIQNLVATHHVKHKIDIKALTDANSTFCTYDREGFPGAIMRHPELDNITILVFKSGNLVITGAKLKEKAMEAVIKVYPILTQFSAGKLIIPPTDFSNTEKQQIGDMIEQFIIDEER